MTSAIVDLDSAPEGYRPDGKAAPRWAPDLQLVPAMLCTPRWPRRLTDFEPPDRCWIVAGLTIAGWSAEEITERIGGSIRLIRDIRSQPMTSLCMIMHEEVEQLETDLRVERIEHAATRNELWSTQLGADRVRKQLDQILAKLSTGTLSAFPRCGHPKVDWNLYVHNGIDAEGKPFAREYCRECNNTRASKYRIRRKSAGKTEPSQPRVTISA